MSFTLKRHAKPGSVPTRFLWMYPAAAFGGLRRGFSLVEMVLAIGVLSFALIPLVATLPLGLQAVRDSTDQTVTASIAQQIRGDLQQISFSANSSDPSTIDNLKDQVFYYTAEGIRTADGLSNVNVPAGAYYKATFKVDPASVLGAGGGGAMETFGTASARVVRVMLAYPATASPAPKKIVFALFEARQPSIN